MDKHNIPVQEILIRYAGNFPISDDAIFNILEQLQDAQDLPPRLQPAAARYAVKVICAILPELDVAKPEDALTVCGLDASTHKYLAASMIQGEGPWAGEIGPLRIRELLFSIQDGEYPEDAAQRLDIDPGQMLHLNHLLALPEYWHDEILQRVLMVRHEGGKWLSIARLLNTWRPSIILSWVREARSVEKEIRARVRR
jgi:hypothetical protein